MTGLLCTEPRSVLILGTGYLGKALAESLRQAGHTALTADIDAQKAIYEADVTEGASMHSLAARIPSPHIIVMCASTRGGSEEAYRSLYIRGTQNTLEAFPGTPVIFCSSTSVYGITDGRWITEEHNVYPASGKSGLLIQAEQAVLAAGGTVVRLGALYGPDRCVLVSQYCKKGAALPGNMDRWINYIHRDDAVAALHLLCTDSCRSAPPSTRVTGISVSRSAASMARKRSSGQTTTISVISRQLAKARMLRSSTLTPCRGASSLSNPARREDPAATMMAAQHFMIVWLTPCGPVPCR